MIELSTTRLRLPRQRRLWPNASLFQSCRIERNLSDDQVLGQQVVRIGFYREDTALRHRLVSACPPHRRQMNDSAPPKRYRSRRLYKVNLHLVFCDAVDEDKIGFAELAQV